MISPNTEVRLLSNVPFNATYDHTRRFESVTDQSSYFLSKASYTFTDFTYQREERAVMVPRAYDDLYLCNYLMYRNNSFGTKWFYGFITRKEYVNPNFTRVYFELDVMQTWHFDMQWKPSFVVREHCQRWNTDGTPVINTVPEELNYGTEYQIATAEQYRPCDGIYFMVVAAKQGMHGNIDKKYYASLNGVPQLLVYYVHPFRLDGSVPNTNLGALSDIASFLGALNLTEGAVNNIVSIYITDCLPNNPGYNNNVLSFDTSNFQFATIGTTDTIFISDMNYGSWGVSMGDKYNGYTGDEESKLLMHPYTVLELVDMRGNKATYKNEYIMGDTLQIIIHSSLGVQNKVVYNIKDYLTGSLSDDPLKEKITLETGLVNNEPNDMPILTDLLSAYLQGNRNSLINQKNQINFNGYMGVAQTALGAQQRGMMSGTMAAEGVQTAGNSIFELQAITAKIKDIDNVPPQLSKMGSNTYFDYGNGLTGVWIIKKEITDEYRKKLSDFFKMYGYKVNELKVPNLHTRQHFNFVQTAGANLTGNIPNQDMDRLKSIFDNGITLWHGDWVLDYSKANGEL
jgi:hypothetical protein